MKIRNLVLGEELPQELRCGYEAGKNTDPNWIWIAEHEGVPVAILVAAPMHVAVFLIRLAAIPAAPNETVWSLLRHAFLEIDRRGFAGYFTIFNPAGATESRLLRIIKSVKGYEVPQNFAIAFGDLKFIRKEVTV